MPLIFRQDGLRFHFYSREGSPREPVHIHIAAPGRDAKFWVSPEVRMAYNHGFDARTLRGISAIVIERRQEVEDAWIAHFAGSD